MSLGANKDFHIWLAEIVKTGRWTCFLNLEGLGIILPSSKQKSNHFENLLFLSRWAEADTENSNTERKQNISKLNVITTTAERLQEMEKQKQSWTFFSQIFTLFTSRRWTDTRTNRQKENINNLKRGKMNMCFCGWVCGSLTKFVQLFWNHGQVCGFQLLLKMYSHN